MRYKCFSYHAIAEDYGELEDKLTKIEEQVSQEQMVELLMSVLTEKQKEILKKVYWEQKTHKQIASMYGMSRSSVSDAVHKAQIADLPLGGAMGGVLYWMGWKVKK